MAVLLTGVLMSNIDGKRFKVLLIFLTDQPAKDSQYFIKYILFTVKSDFGIKSPVLPFHC